MFRLSPPNREQVLAFINSQENLDFSYPEIGATREQAPRNYTVDHNRIQLGAGAETFHRAKAAIHAWKMFDMPWIDLCWPDAQIAPGSTVAVLVSHFGFCSVNACRIVYLLAAHGNVEKYGFAYGTLPEHGEIGEERFSVEYHALDQSVWYDLYAFSRPRPLAALAYPFTRALQRRFARDSKAAMYRAVNR